MLEVSINEQASLASLLTSVSSLADAIHPSGTPGLAGAGFQQLVERWVVEKKTQLYKNIKLVTKSHNLMCNKRC